MVGVISNIGIQGSIFRRVMYQVMSTITSNTQRQSITFCIELGSIVSTKQRIFQFFYFRTFFAFSSLCRLCDAKDCRFVSRVNGRLCRGIRVQRSCVLSCHFRVAETIFGLVTTNIHVQYINW